MNKRLFEVMITIVIFQPSKQDTFAVKVEKPDVTQNVSIVPTKQLNGDTKSGECIK